MVAPQPLLKQARAVGPVLLQGLDDPHAEWLTMVWGPRFDRAHALALWASMPRAPVDGEAMLGQLLRVADAFDALDRPAQQRLRHLILRHGAQSRLLH